MIKSKLAEVTFWYTPFMFNLSVYLVFKFICFFHEFSAFVTHIHIRIVVVIVAAAAAIVFEKEAVLVHLLRLTQSFRLMHPAKCYLH